MVIDPIADMIIRIKNAQAIRKDMVSMPTSKIKEAIAKVLIDNGYIEALERKEATPADELHLTLRYDNKEGAIHHIQRVSRPGARKYSRVDAFPRPLSGHGLVIISTPQGIMSGRQAEKLGIGGEILATVW
jgi:small subunit ribosomal protein S8